MAVMTGKRGGEIIDRLSAGRSAQPWPEYRAILEGHHQRIDEINEQPLIESEKTRRRAAAEESTREAARSVREKKRQRIVAEHEQAIGRSIQAGRRDDLREMDAPAAQRHQALTALWTLRLSTVANTTTPALLEAMAEDAIATGNQDIIRAALPAVLQQTARLASVEREGNPETGGPVSDAHARLSATYGRWAKANPTPSDMRREAERARDLALQQLDQDAQIHNEAFGLTWI